MKRLWFQMFLPLGIMMLALSFHIPSPLAAPDPVFQPPPESAPQPVFKPAPQPAPEEAVQAAAEGIPFFLGNSSSKELALFGFANSAEVRSATVGEGFMVSAALPQYMQKDQSMETLSSITTPMNQYQFLVYASGKPACLITVEKDNGKWAPVSIGSRGLSHDLHSLTKSWPKSQGYSYDLIRVYQARADFVELNKESESIGVVPTESGRVAIGMKDEAFDPKTLLPPTKIVDTVAPIVQDSLRIKR